MVSGKSTEAERRQNFYVFTVYCGRTNYGGIIEFEKVFRVSH